MNEADIVSADGGRRTTRQFVIRVMRFNAAIALIPLGVGFIKAWSAGFGVLLVLFGLPGAAILFLIGTIYWLFKAVFAPLTIDTGLGRMGLLTVVVAFSGATVLLSWPLLATGSHVGDLTKLAVYHRLYERIIAQTRQATASVWYETDGGVTYSTDLGPPVRVAFGPAGMLDNWSGIIYDPTGDVMLARGFDPVSDHFHAPDRITKLFEGDLTECRHLWSSYYSCSFT